MTGLPRRTAALASAAALLAVFGCAEQTVVVAESPGHDLAFSTQILDLDFDTLDELNSVSKEGDAGEVLAQVQQVTDGETQLGLGPALDGAGHALVYPPFAEAGAGLAVLAVIPLGTRDAFSPGSSDFEFGADLRLDPVNEGSKIDNGNNVMQRGLFADPAQYKIQIDHGVASCRIAGTEGAVTVSADDEVETDHWYNVSCTRVGNQVTLELRDLESPDAAPRTWAESGSIGTVAMATTASPISIGGKLAAGLVVAARNSDQFNGSIDNVTMTVAD